MDEEITKCIKILGDESKRTSMRLNALLDFHTQRIYSPEVIKVIGKILLNNGSDYLKYECAYYLGQMSNRHAIPYLVQTISDENQHIIVRYASGEALGASGKIKKEIFDLLKTYSMHENTILAETCDIALERLDWFNNKSEDELYEYNEDVSCYQDCYDVVDSAPIFTDEFEVEEIYLDESRGLFERLMALFTLRNIGTSETTEIICQGLLASPFDSALLKHHAALVLHQIHSLDSVNPLGKKMADLEEDDFVRIECVKALNSLGELDIVRKYLQDKSQIIRECCQVILDMANCQRQ